MCYGYDSNILKFMNCTIGPIGPIGPWMFDDVHGAAPRFFKRGSWLMAMVQNSTYNILKLEGCRNKTHETNTFEYISYIFILCSGFPIGFIGSQLYHPSHHGTMAETLQDLLFRRRGRRKSRRFDRDFDHLGYGKLKIMGETDLIKHQTSWILMNSDEFWWIWWIHCYLSHTQMVDRSYESDLCEGETLIWQCSLLKHVETVETCWN